MIELATGASLRIPARGESKGKVSELSERLGNKKNKDLRILSDFIPMFLPGKSPNGSQGGLPHQECPITPRFNDSLPMSVRGENECHKGSTNESDGSLF